MSAASEVFKNLLEGKSGTPLRHQKIRETKSPTSSFASIGGGEKKYYKEFLFSEIKKTELRSISDSSEILDPELLTPLAEQESFVQWLRLYIIESQTNPTWSSKIPHQKFLLSWGPDGMGKLTQTTILAAENRVNLLYCSLYTLKTGMWCSIFKRALEIQPAIVFIDNFANLFSREYSHYMTEFCAIFREYLHNPKTRVWVVACSTIEPISQIEHFKFLLKLVHDYGTVTLVPSLESSDQRTRQNLAKEMIRSIFEVGTFPNPSDEEHKVEWQKILESIGAYSRYSTLKELKDFIIRVHQNTYATWFASFSDNKEDDPGERCDFSLGMIIPNTFKNAFSTLKLLKEDDCVRTIVFDRRVSEDYYQQNSLWASYSIKFAPTPFNSLHSFASSSMASSKSEDLPFTRPLKHTSSITTDDTYEYIPTTPTNYLPTQYSPTSPAQHDFDDYSLNASEYNPSGYFMSSPSRQPTTPPSRSKRRNNEDNNGHYKQQDSDATTTICRSKKQRSSSFLLKK